MAGKSNLAGTWVSDVQPPEINLSCFRRRVRGGLLAQLAGSAQDLGVLVCTSSSLILLAVYFI